MGTVLQFGKMEKVLGTDGAAGCTAGWMCVMWLTCMLKNVKMVNFILCVFYHNLKNMLKGRKEIGHKEKGRVRWVEASLWSLGLRVVFWRDALRRGTVWGVWWGKQS